MAARSRSQRSRLSARAQSSGGAGGVGLAAMLVTSWAFTVLRRCKSADGKRSGGQILQAPGHLEDIPARQVSQVVRVELGQRLQRLGASVN